MIFQNMTTDGEPISQKIINFFQTSGQSEENCRSFYKAAVDAGEVGGTPLFDQAIEIICEELQLDANELEQLIKDQSIDALPN